MTTLHSNRCNRCDLWERDDKTINKNDPNWAFGQCRLNPPVIIPTIASRLMPEPVYRNQTEPEIGTISVYTASLCPVTFATDRCGQFVPIGGWQAPC